MNESEARDHGAGLALEAEARKYELEAAISWAARSFREFTSDEVHAWLDHQGITELSHPNALGAAFLVAAKAGVIENTGMVRKSTRTGAHRRAIAIWRSTIFRAPWPMDGPTPAEEGDK